MSLRFPVFLIAALLLIPCDLFGQSSARNEREMRRMIDRLIDQEAFSNAFWGISIKNLESGKTIYERNAASSFIPASNTKLYTTAAVLDQLGPEFRYETTIWTDGKTENGILTGNLVIRGSGDPSISGRYFEDDVTAVFKAWADSLKDMGIWKITGDIVGDDDLFDDQPLGFGWNWDDEPFGYSAELGALVLNENCVSFTIEGKQTDRPANITYEPAVSHYITFDNRTVTVPADSSKSESYSKRRAGNHFILEAEIPAGHTEKECLSISNPTLFFVETLKQVLLQSGISIGGRPVDIDDLSFRPDYAAGSLTKLFGHHSPAMRLLVEQTNKDSNNLFAEQLLRTLGATFDSTAIGSAESGIRVAEATYAAAAVDTSRLQLVDGSGLSRRNLISPEMTVDLLAYMQSHPDTTVHRAWFTSLPIAGVDGTLEHRFSGVGLARTKARAKTGHVGNVSTLSGYVETAGGTPLAFSIMCNNFTAKTRKVDNVQDTIVNLLAGYRR